ncbi:hypothetical protein OAT23_01415 [Candidatus Pelagibacter sp.]|nr:hypothetical protein [Candidatus Pelagibacter sp.]
MTKNKNIPQWQKSVFDKSVDKNSCVKTKPISTSMIKKIDKDFFDQNYQKMKIINPELYQEYKKEFGIKNKSKITKNDINNNIKKIDDKKNIKKIVAVDEANEKLLDTKIIEVGDLTDNNKSSSFNQTNSDYELKKYIEQKKLERKIEIDQLRKEQEEPKIKFETVKKDLNCGMGFVDPHKPIHQNSLGYSQSWRFKKQKTYRYYD